MNKFDFVTEDIRKNEEMLRKISKEDAINIANNMNEITRGIREKEDNAAAMEFTKVICGILKENGVSVVARKYIYDRQFNKTFDMLSENYGVTIEGLDFSQHDKELVEKIEELQSEAKKYRKAFEGAKKDRDCQVAEYRNRTEKDRTEIERAKNTINQIDDILEKLFGVRHDVGKPDEFEKILSERIKGNITDFLPREPIKVADMLINAEGEYERNPIEKAFCGTDKGAYRIFEVSELRQIAEHLLVYCNHNGEEEE